MVNDRARRGDISQPQTAFEMLSDDEGIQRILIRLSHVQYDGQSLAILAGEIRLLLQGHERELEGSFAEYLYVSRKIESEQGVEY